MIAVSTTCPIGRHLTVSSVSAAAIIVLAGAALAQQPSPQVSDRTATYGQTISLESGAGACNPGADGRLAFHYKQGDESFDNIAPAPVDAAGNMKASYTIPSRQRVAELGAGPGPVLAVFECTGPTRDWWTVEFEIVEREAADGIGEQLPRTGRTEALISGGAGAALVTAGAVMLAAARRRPRQS